MSGAAEQVATSCGHLRLLRGFPKFDDKYIFGADASDKIVWHAWRMRKLLLEASLLLEELAKEGYLLANKAPNGHIPPPKTVTLLQRWDLALGLESGEPVRRIRLEPEASG